MGEENDYSDVNFTTDGLIHEKTPIDYEKLKDDQEYHFYLKTLKHLRFWFVELDNKSVVKTIEGLLKNIEDELEKVR